jgi:hypothetical protein
MRTFNAVMLCGVSGYKIVFRTLENVVRRGSAEATNDWGKS